MKKCLSFIKKNYLLIILIVIAFVVFFTNLSGQDYSLDEPETIVLAKAISKYGFPSPWDGQNLISQDNGKALVMINESYFWQWHPWVQHYLVFLGINIFGDNLFGQRFFFPLFGVFSIILTYFIAQSLFSKRKLVAFLISLQVIFSLPFFLYIRNARYYSPSIFFSLAIFYLIILNFKNKWNKKNTIFFFITGLLLFFTNYVVWLTTVIFALFTLLFKRNKQIFFILISQIVVAIIWFSVFKPYSSDVFVFNQLLSVPENILKNFSYINSFIFPLILIPFLLFVKKLNKHFLLFILALIILKIVIYSIFLIPHGRYLVDLFIVFILLFGYFYDYLLSKKNWVLLFFFFIIVSFTNLFNIFLYIFKDQQKFVINFWPQKYYIELTEKKRTIMPQIGEYLKNKYKKGDLFLSNDYPWTIYLYSNVPSFSMICDDKKGFLVPKEISDKDNIRWLIGFPLNNRSIYKYSCLNYKSLQDIEKKFKLIKLNFDKDTRVINDVDIYNRQFPPMTIREDEVYLFERKD